MANRRTLITSSATGELIPVFKKQLKMSKLTKDEFCLVITDTAFNPQYGDACLAAALEIGAETVKLVLPYTSDHPSPKALKALLPKADLIVYMSTHTLHYREEMSDALDSGSRALMVVQPLHVLQRLDGNEKVIARCKAGAALLSEAKTIRITSEAGTDLTMERGDRPCLANYGVADTPGHLDFWGAGMTQTAQLEETMEGTLVLNTGDLIFYLGRYIENPVSITFKKGKIVQIEGKLDAFLLRKYLEDAKDERAYWAGHIAFGLDHRAQWGAQIIEFPEAGSSAADAETYYGNVQIELGSNDDVTFKGKNRANVHLGLCSLGCSMWFDDKQILDNGKYIPEDLK